MTIPKGTLFPMCGMNLAFDRELIGPAMYFGLMGDGQPIGRYDDMWAGWCIKVLFIDITQKKFSQEVLCFQRLSTSNFNAYFGLNASSLHHLVSTALILMVNN